MNVRRFSKNPIITPELDPSIGTNINGPSLIRVPDWLPNPLGNYYLYFAHHQGKFIRLAYADQLEGPWIIYGPGTLALEKTPCHDHIASPDVHVDHEKQQIVMYYHGPLLSDEEASQTPVAQLYPMLHGQRSLVATSRDGLQFVSGTEHFGPSYFRVFQWRDAVYAMGMPGIFFRSQNGLTEFELGPFLFDESMRHAALKLDGDILSIFYSRAGDCPERILMSQVMLTEKWLDWTTTEPIVILESETDYEGANLPLEPSQRGAIHEPAHQLRDPCIFREEDRTYLLYSVAGESGIAIAELLP
ncbi:hypothetical protein KFU94_02195 [Chloroflexi bacterium TSY]|nr:hypothetical protein [Chloroflexi bacterium TSY]